MLCMLSTNASGIALVVIVILVALISSSMEKNGGQ